MVCDKSYHRLTVEEFQELIRWESKKNRHHVFPARLIKGASTKAGLKRGALGIKFGINLKEVKLVPVAAHCFYNDLFRNSSPIATSNKLYSLVSGKYSPFHSKKLSFIKFSLCVAKEKLQSDFNGMAEIAKAIDIDINDGNSLQVQDIIDVLKLTESDIIGYLESKFFPKNYQNYPAELWDLYL